MTTDFEFLQESGRVKLSDKKFINDLSKEKIINVLFERLVAKNINFKDMDFSYCIFDATYLRNCKFEDCNFTGCRFINTNLNGSTFTGCKFDYVNFEKTQIDVSILDNCCPSVENLKLKFARTLRLNYQQIGDTASANKAINIELDATRLHYCKAWQSKESYYRKKYQGLQRFKAFIDWLKFIALDFIWGNGESIYKLLRAVFFVLIGITIFNTKYFLNPYDLKDYLKSFILSPQIFFGVGNISNYPNYFITLTLVLRLVLFGFFMSIIIRRFSRR